MKQALEHGQRMTKETPCVGHRCVHFGPHYRSLVSQGVREETPFPIPSGAALTCSFSIGRWLPRGHLGKEA